MRCCYGTGTATCFMQYHVDAACAAAPRMVKGVALRATADKMQGVQKVAFARAVRPDKKHERAEFHVAMRDALVVVEFDASKKGRIGHRIILWRGRRVGLQ